MKPTMAIAALFILCAVGGVAFSAVEWTGGEVRPIPAAAPAVTPSPLQPVGVAAPSGMVWVTTLDDEFTESAVNSALWNYGFSNDALCRNAGCTEGVECSSARCNDDFNFENDSISGGLLNQIPIKHIGTGETNYGGMAGINTSTKFVQRYGYFEWRGELPSSNTSSSGNWPAYWMLPEVHSDSPGTPTKRTTNCGQVGNAAGTPDGHNEEVDLMEDGMGGKGLIGTGSAYSVQATISDYCSLEWQVDMYNGQDLTATMHTYGLSWVRDGTPEGTMCVYLDGRSFGCHPLDSSSLEWRSGIYLLTQMVYCAPNGILGAGPCTAKSTEALKTDYVRVWQAVPISDTTPTASATPTPH
ncbi:MAG TPA: hypothetical protein VNE82_11530 [Candidatus Binataceae bacterium]|nr:hypothetical protein [Candidatus Binataceae bacterium]